MTTPVYPTPTLVAVRKYLLSAFVTAVKDFSDPNVEVFSFAETHETTNDLVILRGAARQLPNLALVGSGGQFWQHEQYSMPVDIATFVAGNDPDTNPIEVAYERAVSILSALEIAIRKDPSAGGLVIEMKPSMTEDECDWDESGRGALCNITLTVQVSAAY